MASHTPQSVDEEQITRAEDMWQSFTAISKWAVIATCASLVLLALIFV